MQQLSAAVSIDASYHKTLPPSCKVLAAVTAAFYGSVSFSSVSFIVSESKEC